MIGILQQPAGVVSWLTMLCRPISPISAMMLRLWQMWPLGENTQCLTPKWQLVRKRNLQANLLQQQHPKQTLWSNFLLLPQKVRPWILVILPYVNADHNFILWLRCPWTSIWRRRRSSAHTSSSITHHSGMILLTWQVFKLSHDPEFGIIPLWFHQAQHSPSAPKKPRTNSPLINVWFQSSLVNTFRIFWQTPFSLPTMRCLNYLASQTLQSQVLHHSPSSLLAPT